MFTHIRRRRILAAALAGAAFAALGVTVASSRGASSPELVVANLATPGGHFAAIDAGVSYQASTFPLALRITAPDATWGAAQWKTISIPSVARSRRSRSRMSPTRKRTSRRDPSRWRW